MSATNLIFGTMLLFQGIALIIIWYFAYHKKKNMNKTCSKCTIGNVIRYSSNGKISLPVVKYHVDGKNYKVVGPKFYGYVNVTIPSVKQGFESEVTSNLTTRENLPDTIKVCARSNVFASKTANPLAALYPVGSDAPVYYDPSNPKRAYVQRFLAPSKFYIFVLCLGIALMGIGIVFFFLPV